MSDLFNEDTVEHDCLLLEVVSIGFFLTWKINLWDFREKLDGLESGASWTNQVAQHVLNQFSLKDVPRWNPTQEDLKSLQTVPDQWLLNWSWVLYRLIYDKLTELVNDSELVHHPWLHLSCLTLKQRVLAEVKHLLAQQSKDLQHILTLVLALVGLLAEVGDKGLAAIIPVLLYNTDQSCINFG